MFPLERIRPILGQNLAKVDVIRCNCSLFDLSGAKRIRPQQERYYRDTDAIIYVVNSSEISFDNIQQSRKEFKKLCQNEVLKRRLERGLPLMIFANGLDVAYGEQNRAVKKANEADQKRQVTWNTDEEDAFVGGKQQVSSYKKDEEAEVSNRALGYHDLLKLFGVSSAPAVHHQTSNLDPAQCNGDNSINSMCTKGNIFLFGGSAKSGEGVKSAVEYLLYSRSSIVFRTTHNKHNVDEVINQHLLYVSKEYRSSVEKDEVYWLSSCSWARCAPKWTCRRGVGLLAHVTQHQLQQNFQLRERKRAGENYHT